MYESFPNKNNPAKNYYPLPKNYIQSKSQPIHTNSQSSSPLQSPSLQQLYTTFIPNLSHSALKLYIYYTLQSQLQDFNNKLDLVQFCETSNTSPRASYIALSQLKQKQFIPSGVTFTNTAQINSYQK